VLPAARFDERLDLPALNHATAGVS
jgi:hypothetical protein